MSTILSEFGPYLRQLRHGKNLTLRQLAAETAIPHTTLYQLESGAMNPRLTELVTLSDAFGKRLPTFLDPVVRAASNGSPVKATPAPKKKRPAKRRKRA
jgi:transcriptional regulator with XRE-family HTH domain